MSYSTYGVEVEKQNGLVIGKHFNNLDDAMCVAERAVYERGCVWSCVYKLLSSKTTFSSIKKESASKKVSLNIG